MWRVNGLPLFTVVVIVWVLFISILRHRLYLPSFHQKHVFIVNNVFDDALLFDVTFVTCHGFGCRTRPHITSSPLRPVIAHKGVTQGTALAPILTGRPLPLPDLRCGGRPKVGQDHQSDHSILYTNTTLKPTQKHAVIRIWRNLGPRRHVNSQVCF